MTPEQDPNQRVIGGPDAQHTYDGELPASLAPLPGYGHLADYVRDLHIITGPNGMCRCREDGLTCGQRLAAVSADIRDAQIAAEIGHNTK